MLEVATTGYIRTDCECWDNFRDDCAAGKVIGTLSESGHKRLGFDVEGVISIDNGALRIAPLIEAGFARAVIAYGPFPRKAGTAFAVYLLNGRNSSQAEPLPDTFRERIRRWFVGSETDPKWERMLRWLSSGRVRRTFRQFRWWLRTAKGAKTVPLLNENLAVGLFPTDVVRDPRIEGSTFIMHALGPENGELWAGGSECRTRSLWGVQDLPLYLVAVMRPEGTVYYVNSLYGVRGLAPYPSLKPIALDQNSHWDNIYFGIQQSVLGQIGFRLDTRVEGVRVAHVKGYDEWYGGAHAADRLIGKGVLEESLAEIGGKWQALREQAPATLNEAIGSEPEKIAFLDPGLPSGLIHAHVSPEFDESAKIGIVWRCLDERNHWRLEILSHKCEIVLVEKGKIRVIACGNLPDTKDKGKFRLQVLDDGQYFMVYIDGQPLSKGWFEDRRFEEATRVGLLINDSYHNGLGAITFFEAHPRHITLPEALDMGSPWYRTGDRLILADEFDGEASDLQGRLAPVGGLTWKRIIGKGVIEITGDGAARVRASTQNRCPNRTAYCLDWDYSDFADLEVTMTPPGTEMGQKQHGTAGFILYQDPENYVTLNVWRADYYAGASTSTFFKFDGFEDVYDAVWSNIGNRMYYGCPSRLRLCCDGERYLVFVDDEPVLYRAFRDVYPTVKRLRIQKIGLIANWEWGTDTGSKFEHFRARI